MLYIEFLPFLPVEKTFEYSCEFDVAAGDIVRCRFGAFDCLGAVLSVHRQPQTTHNLSSVKESVFSEVLTGKMPDFMHFLARYYGYDYGVFAKLAFPFGIKDCVFQMQEQMVKLVHGAESSSSKSSKWHAIFNTLKNTDGLPASMFTGLSVFKKKDLVEFFHRDIVLENKQVQGILNANLPDLSDAQAAIRDAILEAYQAQVFSVHLIFGKTGSGKTEVYIHLIKQVIAKNPNGQVLLMLPEIGLAKVIAQRLELRFGIKVPVWNSAVADGVRKRQYQEIAAGGYNIVVGTRSALFLPYPKLEMIIVDEEHDFSYKQEEVPVYNARDCAVVYGKMLGVPVVLGSATPSVESMHNAQIGKYNLHKLDSRFNAVMMPKIEIVREKSRSILCNTLKAQIQQYYSEGKQVLVFLNRRGFSPINECKACKSSFRCDSCDSFLTYHKKKGVLICHKCGISYPIYLGCMMCGEELTIVSSGCGVEAVYEEIVELLGTDSGIRIFSSDEQNTERKLEEFISSVQNGDTKIIIGTQIASKGYDFPNLKLVCIVDLILKNDDIDFKADEKLMQLLVQVSGRSGRAGEQGLVMIQSRRNENALQKIMDTEQFYSGEIAARKQSFLPPFSRFIAVIFLGKNERFLAVEAGNIAEQIKKETNATVLGPAPAAIAFIKNIYRYRILIVTSRQNKGLPQKLKAMLSKTKCKTKIDVDAINFY